MLFFSGVFFPLDNFPGWMKTLAEFLPLTHAVRDLAGRLHRRRRRRASAGGLAGLAVLAAVVFTVSIRMMRKRLIK